MIIFCANKYPENTALFKEIIVLRDEAARLLGYPNHATFRIQENMAKTPQRVNDFLKDLGDRLASKGTEEIKQLKQLKKSTTGRAEHFFQWDYRFYDKMKQEKDHQVDDDRISEYFPLQTSISGMLNIFEEIFGMRFVEIVGEHRDQISATGKGGDIVWHPDVQVFAVWDDEGEGGDFLGYLYLDPFPRDGKSDGARTMILQPGFMNENGTRGYPATALFCNFSAPTPKKPSLLKHREVVTLFHELGHGIQDLVFRPKYSSSHRREARDFVEIPSKMLENWCWTSSQLKKLSTHWSYLTPEHTKAWEESHTGSKRPEKDMPDDLIRSIIDARDAGDALYFLRQLHHCIFDMAVHEPKSHDSIEKLDPSDTYNRLTKGITELDGPEVLGQGYNWGHSQSESSHFVDGYDAGYYGYMWAEAISADMFSTVFKPDPMNGKEGRRYRHAVLECGGYEDEMQRLKDLLCRPPSSDAFFKMCGIL